MSKKSSFYLFCFFYNTFSTRLLRFRNCKWHIFFRLLDNNNLSGYLPPDFSLLPNLLILYAIFLNHICHVSSLLLLLCVSVTPNLKLLCLHIIFICSGYLILLKEVAHLDIKSRHSQRMHSLNFARGIKAGKGNHRRSLDESIYLCCKLLMGEITEI